MVLVQRGREPTALTQYKAQPDACYEELPPLAKNAIRSQMLEEQGYLCAYCMRRLADESQTRIEHYHARSPQGGSDGDGTLNYHNMLGVCYGNSLHPNTPEESKTCDAHRHNALLTVNPFSEASIQQIRYRDDGTICSDNPDIWTDLNRTLNLNSDATPLKRARKQALDAIKQDLHRNIKKGASHEAALRYIRKRYEHYRNPGSEKRAPYVGIIFWYLEKHLK